MNAFAEIYKMKFNERTITKCFLCQISEIETCILHLIVVLITPNSNHDCFLINSLVPSTHYGRMIVHQPKLPNAFSLQHSYKFYQYSTVQLDGSTLKILNCITNFIRFSHFLHLQMCSSTQAGRLRGQRTVNPALAPPPAQALRW